MIPAHMAEAGCSAGQPPGNSHQDRPVRPAERGGGSGQPESWSGSKL